MRGRRKVTPSLDLTSLPPEARAAIGAAVSGREVRLREGDRDLGVLLFRPSVVAGVVVEAPRLPLPEVEVPEGVRVVATAMKLSAEVRRRMADSFGPDYVVLDFHEAPASTNIVLVNPVSPQLLAELKARFPASRVIVTEIEDEELGVACTGPVGRLMDAGASAYLPPRPVDDVVDDVRAHVEGGAHRQAVGPSAARTAPPKRELGPGRPPAAP